MRNRSGGTRALSSTSVAGDEIVDIVKKFKVSNEHARETGSIPHNVFKNTLPFSRNCDMHACKSGPVEWDLVVASAVAVYFDMGAGCSEKSYQKALLYSLYGLDIPCLIERPVYMIKDGLSVLKGFVDLEIAGGRFVLELKISPPTASNLRNDKKQLRRYISAYKANGSRLERAALVYYGNSEVRIVEVSVNEEDSRMRPY